MPPDISHGAQVVIPAAFSSTAGAHQQHLTNHSCEDEKLRNKKIDGRAIPHFIPNRYCRNVWGV